MPEQSPTTIVGCLLDVSGSMRSALEVGRDTHQPATDRFRAIISAALKLAQAEQSRDPSALMFVGAFGLLEEEPAVADLCGVIEALIGEEKDEGKSGLELLIRIANEMGLEHISRYIRTKLTDDEARIVYVHLSLHPQKIQEFVEAIPPTEKVKKFKSASKGLGATMGALGGLTMILKGRRSLTAGAAYTATGARAGFRLRKTTAETIEDTGN